jgi:hypothetical protein
VLHHFDLVMFADQAPTDVPQRVAHGQHGGRGRQADDERRAMLHSAARWAA